LGKRKAPPRHGRFWRKKGKGIRMEVQTEVKKLTVLGGAGKKKLTA